MNASPLGLIDSLKVAFWLRLRDWGVLSRARNFPALAAGFYIAIVAFLCYFLTLIYPAPQDAIDATLILISPLWILWALVPALGSAGDADSWTLFAPYPVSRLTLGVVSWVNAVLDLPYLVPLPLFLATSFAAESFLGLFCALFFALGASLIGQLFSWLGTAFSSKRKGESLLPTFIMVGLSVFLASRSGALKAVFTFLPPGRFVEILKGFQNGHFEFGAMSSVLAWSLLPLCFIPLVISRAFKVRLAGRAQRPVKSLLHPRRVSLLVFLSMLRSMFRSRALKALFLSTVVVPSLVSLVFGPDVFSVASLVFFAIFASAATVSANMWAFDGPGVLLWLHFPLSLRKLLWLRLLVSVVSLLLFSLSTLLVYALFTHHWRDVGGVLPLAFLLTLPPALVGFVVSTFRPSSADMDSLRSRPTTFPSALLFIFSAAPFTLLIMLLLGMNPILAFAVLVGSTFLVVEICHTQTRASSKLLSAF